MNRLGKRVIYATILAVLILGLLPVTVYASSSSDTVLGNNYTLNSGETLHDDLFIAGGNVTLMSESTVNGNVVLLGGNLRAAGTVNGDVLVLGGSVALESTFILNGNLSTAGTSVNRAPGAQIKGQVYTEEDTPEFFIFPGGVRLTDLNGISNPFLGAAGFFLGLFLWTLVAMLVVMFLPAQLTRTSQTILAEPIASTGLGLLTVIVAPIVVILLAITICLIPVALIAAFVFALAWAFGLIALGFEVGKRISTSFKVEWHPVIAAGLGTLLLMAVLNGLQALIPCVGWIPKGLIGLLGLGAVLLTQFGTKSYPAAPLLPVQIPNESLPPAPPPESNL